MTNSFAEEMLKVYRISKPYHVRSIFKNGAIQPEQMRNLFKKHVENFVRIFLNDF